MKKMIHLLDPQHIHISKYTSILREIEYNMKLETITWLKKLREIITNIWTGKHFLKFANKGGSDKGNIDSTDPIRLNFYKTQG